MCKDVKLTYQELPLDFSKSDDHSDEINCEDESNIDLHEDEMKQETDNDLNYKDEHSHEINHKDGSNIDLPENEMKPKTYDDLNYKEITR